VCVQLAYSLAAEPCLALRGDARQKFPKMPCRGSCLHADALPHPLAFYLSVRGPPAEFSSNRLRTKSQLWCGKARQGSLFIFPLSCVL